MEWLILIVLAILVGVLFGRLRELQERLRRLENRLADMLYQPAPRRTPETPPQSPEFLRHREEETRGEEPPSTLVQPPPVVEPPPIAQPWPTTIPPVQPPPTEPRPASQQRPGWAFTYQADLKPSDAKPAAAPSEEHSLRAFREAQALPVPPQDAPFSVPPPTPHRRSRAEWEALIGGNLLNRIGILAVIIAMAFFVKLAYDQGWIAHIPPVVRDMLAAVVGLLFLWAGRYFYRKSLPIFAQGFLGGGIAMLYLAVFAAFQLHHLLHAALAMILMSLVTFAAFWLALRYDAIAVALLGWAGGYLTPVLLNSGQPNDVGLLVYLMVLTGGLLAVQVKRDDWAILEPLSLLATITLYGIWFTTSYTPATLALTLTFLTFIWAMFMAVDLYRLFRQITTFPDLRLAISIVNVIGYYLGLQLAFSRTGAMDWLATATLLVALAYLGITRQQVVRRSGAVEKRYALTAIVLIVLATYLQFREHLFLTVSLWSVEALSLMWMGTAWKRAYLWRAALVIYGLAFVLLINLPDVFTYQTVEHFNPLLNLRALAFLSLATALAVGTLAARRLESAAREIISLTFHYAWTLLLFLLITIETNDAYRQAYHLKSLVAENGETPSTENLLLPALWTFYSLPLVWLGLRKRLMPLLAIGLIVLVIGIAIIAGGGVSFHPIGGLLPVVNLRALLIIFVIIGVAIEALWLERHHETYAWVKTISGALYVFAALLGFELITAETTDAFHRLIAEGVPGFLGVNPALASHQLLPILWATYSLPLTAIGYRRTSKPLLYTGLSVLTAAAIWTALYGIWYVPLHVKAYLPILNLRMGAFGFVIAAVAIHGRLLARHGEPYPWALTLHGFLRQAMAILGFELLTLELHATFAMLKAHGFHTLLALDIGLAQAAAMALVWTGYSTALIAYACKREQRGYFVTGVLITLLAVVTGAVTGLFYEPLNRFTPLLNPRAAMFALLIFALGIQRQLPVRHENFFGWAKMSTYYRLGIAGLGFEWLTVGIMTFFAKLVDAGVPSTLGLPPEHAGVLILPMAWTAYAVCVTWRGLAVREPALRTAGLLLMVFAAGWSVLSGMTMSLTYFTTYHPLLNLCAGAYLSAILGLVSVAWLNTRYHEADDKPSIATTAFRLFAAVIGFVWLTQEIGFGFNMPGVSQLAFGLEASLAILMALAGAWALYAALLTWLGRRLNSRGFLGMGFTLLLASLLLGVILGFQYVPLENFRLLFNFRTVMFAALLTSLYLHRRWTAANLYEWLPARESIFTVAIAILLFQFVSMETWSHFARLSLLNQENKFSLDLRQMALSLAWLGYAVLLSGFGFWRRQVALRVMALAVYLIAIVKIFVYDLRHLGSLYYIFSLFGLGAVLIATSYLYQRYRYLIIGGMPSSPQPEEADHA